MRLIVAGIAGLIVAVLGGCVSSESVPDKPSIPTGVTEERLLKAAGESSQWLTYGGNYEEQRFSRLKRITTSNIADLNLAWFADYDVSDRQTGTPLFIDGVIYVSTAWSAVYAFDAARGSLVWRYEPRTPDKFARKLCCGAANRGLAAWKGMIYVGTLDGHLVAIDAKTGKEGWSVQTVDPENPYSITGAPRAAKGKILIGNAGGEYGVRGYISAYDADSGRLDWRFYTVPGNPRDGFENEAMKKAAQTWGPGDWWKLGGGGAVWDAIVYDPVTSLVIFGTGNGTPWNQTIRDPSYRDNLYTASIVAVTLDKGEYAWHYQTTPADNWDFDSTSPMTIVDLKWKEQPRRVVIQPSKNGFLYVLDSRTGELLSASKYGDVNWASAVDMKTGRPILNPAARYLPGKPFNAAPGAHGAHGWQGNAYSPETGLIYVPTQLTYFAMVHDDEFKVRKGTFNIGVDMAKMMTFYRENRTAKRGWTSFLQALDPVTGKQVWQTETTNNASGGALATSGGLVFQGGGISQQFHAYDATTGKSLWSFNTKADVVAPPITYELKGEQYVAISVGASQSASAFAPNQSRLLVFKLNGAAALPSANDAMVRVRPSGELPSAASAEEVKAGEKSFGQYCAPCHGESGLSRIPSFIDLRRSPVLYSQDDFDAIVLKGEREKRGMASFAGMLTAAETKAIRSFIIQQERERAEAAGTSAGAGKP